MCRQTYQVVIPERNLLLHAEEGANLLNLLRDANVSPHAPCGGNGLCRKCRVLVNGEAALACQTIVDRNMTVCLPLSEQTGRERIRQPLRDQDMPPMLTEKADRDLPGNVLAIDLGTTTLVCYLLSREGRELAAVSMQNPQAVYGADVIARIQAALKGRRKELCSCIRTALSDLIRQACESAGIPPETICRIALTGNPCMQQLLLDISPKNLSAPPFDPVLSKLQTIPAEPVFPICPHAEFIVVPNISGYVGSDTLGGILASKLYEKDRLTLLVDIGTNAEMVMVQNGQMTACSTAAGPALEGANIRFGMHASEGAIDHVHWEQGRPMIHVIGGGTARGICGSGLVDAAAVMLSQGFINKRGRILSDEFLFEEERAWQLTEDVFLTQSDIRQVQLAKGAVAAGIELMAQQLGRNVDEIDEVLLAGAFGNFVDPQSACRIGLLPPSLLAKIHTVGNVAGKGACLLALSRREQLLADTLCHEITALELASLPQFTHTFGKHINFV